ncbi:hypothetical protein C1645_749473 [Glomus cerebriforme]|uniref:Uncharacterized protein n=1 Tax=Glomus cerebriforme TaxID=658196 RepID=A0A397TKA2_9GLOM|nr:hypothetical protein C1645_749473 [Glomus cerebriforme]
MTLLVISIITLIIRIHSLTQQLFHQQSFHQQSFPQQDHFIDSHFTDSYFSNRIIFPTIISPTSNILYILIIIYTFMCQ